jgi:peptidoglycan hydrolase-like protein with peptidoglycan-binding domain
MGITIGNTIGAAYGVNLVGLAAIALVLLVDYPEHRSPPQAATFSAGLSSPQVSAPSVVEITQSPVGPVYSPPKEEPRPKVTLTRDEVGEVQAWLRAFEIHPGPVDGIAGPRTFAAVKAFASAHQLPETGQLDRAFLETLRRKSGLPLK